LAVVAGGTVHGHQRRIQAAQRYLSEGVSFVDLVGLASLRELSAWEKPKSRGRTEADDLAYRLTSNVRKWPETSPATRAVLVVPTPPERRRPTTVDAIKYLIEERLGRLGRVLFITSSVYAPYTYFRLAPVIGILRAGNLLEVVGSPLEGSAPSLTSVDRLLQEVHATVHAIHDLNH
jgi:hypothetical protein